MKQVVWFQIYPRNLLTEDVQVLDEAKNGTEIVQVKVSTDAGDIVQVVLTKERYENFKIRQEIIQDHNDGWAQFQERLPRQLDALLKEVDESEAERGLRLSNIQLASPSTDAPTFKKARKEAYRYVDATNKRACELQRQYEKRRLHLQLAEVVYNHIQTSRKQLTNDLKAAICEEDHVRLQAAWLKGITQRHANSSHLQTMKKQYKFDISNATSKEERKKLSLDYQRSCAQLGQGGPGIYPLKLTDWLIGCSDQSETLGTISGLCIKVAFSMSVLMKRLAKFRALIKYQIWDFEWLGFKHIEVESC